MRRAYSLLEVLVASALALLVLLMLGSAFVMASRAWGQAQRMQTVQQGTLALSYRLRHDFANSLAGSLRVTPTQLTFLSDDRPDWSIDGSRRFHQWVQYRYWPDKKIVERRVVPVVPPASEAIDPVPSWGPNDRGVRLAEAVTLFEIQSVNASALLQLRLRSQLESSASRVDLSVLPALYGQD